MPVTQAIRTHTTRRKLLSAAFQEFFRFGFQAGSLASIVETAEITKGALFHHFASKQSLGYAVLDEVVAPLLSDRWLAPLTAAADPITALQEAFRHHARADIESGRLALGCPMNNLAQEMSPLDEGFHARISGFYTRWRAHVTSALAQGQNVGHVRFDIDVSASAAFIVFSQIGIWSTGKHSRHGALMIAAVEELCSQLEALRPLVVRHGPRVVRRTGP